MAEAPPPETAVGSYNDENGNDVDTSASPRQEKDGKYELQDSDAWHILGYAFPTWRKWQILMVVFCIQVSLTSRRPLKTDTKHSSSIMNRSVST
jgi:hypothetical protein